MGARVGLEGDPGPGVVVAIRTLHIHGLRAVGRGWYHHHRVASRGGCWLSWSRGFCWSGCGLVVARRGRWRQQLLVLRRGRGLHLARALWRLQRCSRIHFIHIFRSFWVCERLENDSRECRGKKSGRIAFWFLSSKAQSSPPVDCLPFYLVGSDT